MLILLKHESSHWTIFTFFFLSFSAFFKKDKCDEWTLANWNDLRMSNSCTWMVITWLYYQWFITWYDNHFQGHLPECSPNSSPLSISLSGHEMKFFLPTTDSFWQFSPSLYLELFWKPQSTLTASIHHTWILAIYNSNQRDRLGNVYDISIQRGTTNVCWHYRLLYNQPFLGPLEIPYSILLNEN